jgi:SNF2 family DNA or RNA helicase
LIRPFLLQGNIDSSTLKLPRKTELVVWVDFSSKQRRLYELDRSLANCVKSAINGKLNAFFAISMILKLCRHSILMTKDLEQVSTNDEDPQSQDVRRKQKGVLLRLLKNARPAELCKDPKLDLIFHLVDTEVDCGHKILVFSQSAMFLDIVQYVLEQHGIRLLRIDGSTPVQERQDNVDLFNHEDGDIFVMLLTTTAGGVGLTLTGADRVILYVVLPANYIIISSRLPKLISFPFTTSLCRCDPSWSPADDDQAVGRAFRIGQKRSVLVYRLITAGTVEGVY